MNRPEFLSMELEDGSILRIQTMHTPTGDEVNASGDEQIVKSAECLDKAIPQVAELSKGMKDRLVKLLGPDELELEFSVGFSADMGAIIASAGAEAGITVRFVWKNQS